MATLQPLDNPTGNTQQEYDVTQEALIPITMASSEFNPETDKVVFSLETLNGDLLYTNPSPNFTIRNYKNPLDTTSISSVVVFPIQDTQKAGYNIGNYNVFYNFYKPALNSSTYQYFIKEISPNRTEIRLSVNNVGNDEIQSLFQTFSSSLQTEENLFKDFYLNIGEAYYIANNTVLDTNGESYTVLIKLYQPLPAFIETSTQVKVVLEAAETVGFNVVFPPTPIEIDEDVEYIKGPNFNLQFDDEVNNSTVEFDYTSLTTNTELTSSYNNLQNILNQKGIKVNIDYTDFTNFIHFSSAEQRILNFYYKVGLIESASNEITNLLTITGSTSASVDVTSSIASLEKNITNIISNFDGYENYLYYTSESLSYPKSNATAPYTLQPTGSAEALIWLGDLTSSAATYDSENQNNLWYTVPTYLREDPINDGYKVFLNMIGQHFDTLYSYTSTITDRYNTDHRLNKGLSKDLVGDALKSMGLKLYQNNFSIGDPYASLLGINGSGSLLPPTGSEIIETYVTASDDIVPLDDISKETYKRLYHNLPYLLKKKGTVAGLRALITCFGIPDTILRITEFGGKDKLNLNAKDYTREVFDLDTHLTSSVSSSQPLVGIKNRISDKIRIYTGSIVEGDTLSLYRTLQSSSEEYTNDINYVEVAFSPQNEINDLLTSSLNIGEYIGDPRFQSSSLTSYPDLDNYRDTLFEDLGFLSGSYNWKDYIRLIKYFDNSLFKMVKDFVPARSELSTGVVIKQHILERNRVRPPQIETSQHDYSGSIESGFISGGSAGVYDDLESVSPQVTQSWSYEVNTPLGPVAVTQSTQDEFYNGELDGSDILVTDGNLNNTRVIETADIDEGFTALYNTVIGNISTFNFSQNNGQFSYTTDQSKNPFPAPVNTLLIPILDTDFNDIEYYLQDLKIGDQINIKQIGGNYTAGQNYQFIVNGPTEQFYLNNSAYIIPVEINYITSFDWACLGEDESKNWDIFLINDPSITNLQTNLKGDEPLQNNIATPTFSNIYMDIDYSDSVTKPINFNQLINNTAVKAPIQDSNYSQKGWSNSRYNGSRISSPDFNVIV